MVPTGCCHDCGGRCVLKAHVRDGVIVRIETDDGEEPQLRACLRGRAYRQRVYSPDRLKYPMRRVGARGEGNFERVSWDQALDEVAAELKRIKASYGPPSILFMRGSGSQAVFHGAGAVEKLLSMFGGFTQRWGSPSYEGALFASMASYGTMVTGHTRDDFLNSRLIIMWGWNPAETVWDPTTSLYLARAKEAGARIVSIDPRLTPTGATFADQWVPIRPGTDTAMVLAMAYVMVKEGLHDQKFLDTYTVGFDRFKEYLTGLEDGVAKTPAWAEPITGVLAATIEALAREFATTKPAALIPGWGPARSALGEQFSHAAIALIAMTGNIGIPGGFAGGFMRGYRSRELRLPKELRNPVEAGAPPRKDSLHRLRGGTNPSSARIHYTKLYDAILWGRAGGYPADLKMAYIVAQNMLNSHPNVNRGVEALRKLDFVVVQEQFMTPTARFADILLPVNTLMERNDVASPWLGAPYYIYLNKAVDTLYETKSDWEICAELAPRLGIENYTEGKSEEEWLRGIVGTRGDMPTYEDFRRRGVHKIGLAEPLVAFKQQIVDPAHNPFPSLSGKIEIYSEHMAEMNNPKLPPIPKYLEAWEGRGDPLAAKYPLQLITPHPKNRAHSTMGNLPWLREVEPHAVWINAADAQARGIADGDKVLVFNDRGKVLLPARVTERIMPGVVSICEGAWYQPDAEGVDHGGCANVLTRDEHSPGGAVAANTCLVQVRKA